MARYVYGLTHPAFRKYLRLCVSNGDPNRVVEELGTTFTPHPYEVVCSFKSPYALELYRRMTELLAPLRVNADWYKASVVDLLSAWTSAVECGPAMMMSLRRQAIEVRQRKQPDEGVTDSKETVDGEPDLLTKLLREKELLQYRRRRRRGMKERAIRKVRGMWGE